MTEDLRQIGYSTVGLTYSPIRGQNGNIEFLGHFQLNESQETIPDEVIHNIVAQAHADTHK